MKPEICTEDFYHILFDCVDYVSYYQDISDECYDKTLNFLRTISYILSDSSINSFDYEDFDFCDFKDLLIRVINMEGRE